FRSSTPLPSCLTRSAYLRYPYFLALAAVSLSHSPIRSGDLFFASRIQPSTPSKSPTSLGPFTLPFLRNLGKILTANLTMSYSHLYPLALDALPLTLINSSLFITDIHNVEIASQLYHQTPTGACLTESILNDRYPEVFAPQSVFLPERVRTRTGDLETLFLSPERGTGSEDPSY